jgi:hypothetical protein
MRVRFQNLHRLARVGFQAAHGFTASIVDSIGAGDRSNNSIPNVGFKCQESLTSSGIDRRNVPTYE